MPNNSILPPAMKIKYSKEITLIRTCSKDNRIKISNHSIEKLSKRKIKVKDVYDSIENGVVMEIQNFERDIKILFQDSNNIPPTFFVVVAVKLNCGILVTTYKPDPNKWELLNQKQWRRKANV